VGSSQSVFADNASADAWYARVLDMDEEAISLLEEDDDCVAQRELALQHLQRCERANDSFAVTRRVFALPVPLCDDALTLVDALLILSRKHIGGVAFATIAASDNVGLLTFLLTDRLATLGSECPIRVCVVAGGALRCAQHLIATRDANAIRAEVDHSLLCTCLFHEKLRPLFCALPLHALYAGSPEDHNTVLHTAAARGDTDALQLCLTRGMSPAATNVFGESALFAAARSLHVAAAVMLLRADGDGVLVRNIHGQTALEAADQTGDNWPLFRAAFEAELRAWRQVEQRTAVLEFFGFEQPATSKPAIHFQVCSDLHIEFAREKPTYDALLGYAAPARFLALLGDIGVIVNPSYREFVQSCADSGKYERVFCVLGNHEFYRGEYRGVIKEASSVCSSRETITLLHRSAVVIRAGERKVRVMGSTLWTHIDGASSANAMKMNDYRMISNGLGLKAAQLTLDNDAEIDSLAVPPDTLADVAAYDAPSEMLDFFQRTDGKTLRIVDTNAIHKADLAFFNEQCELARQNQEEAVIFVHHAPLKRTGVARPCFWEGDVAAACCTDLRETLIERNPNLVAVCYGHTHWAQNLTILTRAGGRCRIVSNPKGYATDPVRFVASFVLTI
jgi:hypothetical protein